MRKFHVIELDGPAATASDQLNAKIDAVVTRGADVHYLQSVESNGHLIVFLREYDATTKRK